MSQKKALIVDDSTVTRLMIRKIISEEYPNWEILEAESADKAKSILPDHPDIDLFSLDQNMPGTLSGLDLVENLKSNYPKSKIVLITANIQDAIKNKAKDLGILFIEKPITRDKLIPLLETI
ncbi:response regulator [Leptospira biflexa]|jgi:CheY-like chemotaxis protein|uniref:Putative response receiver n=1 Tax=Leptospira biflexa serovar Patoc (strain Patoc 1 / ATCC 23582 / Paris) TaxID=456481 RepID=B0SQU5_LEPBP|nr:response regulator [Leptospira biflexa]ABZ95633.1 Response regulator [Leptospira biflexa serovar Patoc strain 'Patoc 1 (Ames)']ABZ99342.1 Putative response receiver [Leptospira biflexa serovar Patoc strain 'Patoc 1 (Paris)']TGM37311.1 response regulator [Leptospira biflexa]TGM40648.1 response regulator [Leptospira biflexa]TGM46851.1 response regulator [Leptospira biflexa]